MKATYKNNIKMSHKYNLRDRKELNKVLNDIFPSKYMSKKVAESESDESEEYETTDSEEYETESESEDESMPDLEEPLNINITFTMKQEDEPVEVDKADIKKTDEFINEVQTLSKDLADKYKELPMYKSFVKTHNELKEKQDKIKQQVELKEKKENQTKFDKLLSNKPLSDSKYFASINLEEQNRLLEQLTTLRDLNKQQKPNRVRLLESSIPDDYKIIALQKISQLSHGSDGEIGKNKAWLDGFMRLPFGIYHTLPVSITDGPEACQEFMKNAKQCLDDCTYGLNDAKMQILQYIGQLISNPSGAGTAIAIEGPMGTGKTTLVKEGISKILKRPFAFISLGGAQDSSMLDGHMITYEGSVWGQIADILMRSKCMNPVIYFDELDKVSDTPKGEEIIGILTHLTDSTQNQHFKDNYFFGIDLDLSRATLVFSYNNREKLNSILADRMNVIKTEGYTTSQKTIIAKQYLSKHIRTNIAFNEEDVLIPDATLTHIIENYTGQEKGVRNLKRCLETIYAKLNLFRLMTPGTNLFESELSIKVEFPFTVTVDILKKLLKVEEKKNDFMMYL
jgi:ATP-dependent Lon protease